MSSSDPTAPSPGSLSIGMLAEVAAAVRAKLAAVDAEAAALAETRRLAALAVDCEQGDDLACLQLGAC